MPVNAGSLAIVFRRTTSATKFRAGGEGYSYFFHTEECRAKILPDAAIAGVGT